MLGTEDSMSFGGSENYLTGPYHLRGHREGDEVKEVKIRPERSSLLCLVIWIWPHDNNVSLQHRLQTQ